jgi:hypothetical protein
MIMPSYKVHVRRLDAILADLLIEFVGMPAGAEVRGRLMGPRCPGVSTVEIAYQLRRVEPVVYQVLIPEPSLWTPDRPYVYEGPVEWWQDGAKTGATTISVALKDPSAK